MSASPMAAHTTPRMLASLGSWPWCSVVSMSQGLAQLRIVQREERPAVELPAGGGGPGAAQPGGRGDVHPVEREAVRFEIGHDQPEEIDVAHAEDARGDEEEGVALDGPEEEQGERRREVEEDEREGHRRPAALLAADVPGDLLGQVPCPDQEVLGE